MKTLSQKLAKNLEYFTSNPKKRCTNGNSCKYWGKTLNLKTKGCFVGALMPVEIRKWADSHRAMSVSSLIANATHANIQLPLIIGENRNMMQDFQSLHDENENWSEKGLNSKGRGLLYIIIKDFPELNKKDFAKSLAV